MPEKKKDKATLQIIFSSILLAVILLVELYAMINAPGQFIVIGIVGILFIVCLYVLIQGILLRLDMKKQEEEERYSNLIKSEKASYLMLKKYFGEIEEKLNLIERTSKVPTEEIVGTQKGIGKVIINRSRENAEAMLASNDILVDRFDHFEEKIEGNNDKIIASYKSIGEENLNQLLMKQQDIILSLKDMELRLNTAIMQSQKVVAAAPQIITAPMPSVVQEPATLVPEVQPSFEPVTEEPKEELSVEEVQAEEEISDDEINALLADISNDIIASAEEAEPEPEITPEPEAVSEPEAEEKPPMPDLSDPNKMMSPDDIAALLANMGGDDAPAEEPEPIAEPVAEPEVDPEPEAVLEPVAEEKPPMPDLSDPNKMMSPDDIAALLANMGVDDIPEEEPAAEPEPTPEEPEIDLSDPNKKLSADEIAALFASMGN
ncbi:MAG: hypothetical protein ACI4F0_07275 [Agathobacter sp.]